MCVTGARSSTIVEADSPDAAIDDFLHFLGAIGMVLMTPTHFPSLTQ
jgi:hypothetical protein